MEIHNHAGPKNRLLSLLPAEVEAHLAPKFERITSPVKFVLNDVNLPIDYVYFPLNAVASLLVPVQNNAFVEVATVGNEGMVGLPAFLGGDTLPARSIVQVSGELLRMPTAVFRQQIEDWEPLRAVLQRYVQVLFMLVAQSAACNRAHDIVQRCARWLLMTQDRVGGDQFALTQEFLAEMLGVRRASVNEVARRLQQDGLIAYNRGVITVLDRPGLEAQSCACYRIIQNEFLRSLGPAGTP